MGNEVSFMNGDPNHREARTHTSLVIYDGNCGICQAFANWVMRQDREERLGLIAYQHADLNRVAPGLAHESVQQALHFIDARGRPLRGARAVFEVFRNLPGIWGWAGTLLANPILSAVSEPLYRLIARYRANVSGLLKLQVCEPAPSVLRDPQPRSQE